MIPLIAISNNISICVTLNPSAQGMLSVAGTANRYLNTIEFHANFINLKAEVVQCIMLSDGADLTLYHV